MLTSTLTGTNIRRTWVIVIAEEIIRDMADLVLNLVTVILCTVDSVFNGWWIPVLATQYEVTDFLTVTEKAIIALHSVAETTTCSVTGVIGGAEIIVVADSTHRLVGDFAGTRLHITRRCATGVICARIAIHNRRWIHLALTTKTVHRSVTEVAVIHAVLCSIAVARNYY